MFKFNKATVWLLSFVLVGFVVPKNRFWQVHKNQVFRKAKKTLYKLDGFRSVKFGQSKSEAISNIKADFGIKKKDIKVSIHPTQKTTVLSLDIKELSPFLLPAKVTYILGYKTKKITQINIVLASKTHKEKDVVSFVQSAFSLVGYYNDYDLNAYKVVNGVKIKNGLILFGLISKIKTKTKTKTSVLEMTLLNISVNKNKKNELEIKPNSKSKSPVILKMSYVADANSNDIFKIKKNDF